MKLYIVSKQSYDEFYVYGVFSKDKLDAALDELAYVTLDIAKQNRKELQSWFDNTHVPWAKHNDIEPTRPPRLDMDMLEYSKTLFTVTEIELNWVISKPKWV